MMHFLINSLAIGVGLFPTTKNSLDRKIVQLKKYTKTEEQFNKPNKINIQAKCSLLSTAGI